MCDVSRHLCVRDERVAPDLSVCSLRMCVHSLQSAANVLAFSACIVGMRRAREVSEADALLSIRGADETPFPFAHEQPHAGQPNRVHH